MFTFFIILSPHYIENCTKAWFFGYWYFYLQWYYLYLYCTVLTYNIYTDDTTHAIYIDDCLHQKVHPSQPWEPTNNEMLARCDENVHPSPGSVDVMPKASANLLPKMLVVVVVDTRETSGGSIKNWHLQTAIYIYCNDINIYQWKNPGWLFGSYYFTGLSKTTQVIC